MKLLLFTIKVLALGVAVWVCVWAGGFCGQVAWDAAAHGRGAARWLLQFLTGATP